MPILKGEAESVYAPSDVRAIEVSGNSALYKGDYKITRTMPPGGDGAWRLFDMSTDPGETTDLSQQRPKILADMLASFRRYEAENGVLPMPEGYNSLATVQSKATSRFLNNNTGALAVLAVILLALLYGLWRVGRIVLGRGRT